MSNDIGAATLRYYKTVDESDARAVVALFSKRAVYRRPGYPPMVGSDELLAFYDGTRVIVEGRHTIDSVLVVDAQAAVEGRFNGVLRSGETVEIRFADFFRFDGDLIAERATYFDAPAV